MDTFMETVVVLAVISLIVIVAVYRFATQRRQLSSGRNIGQFFPKRHDGKFIFENMMTITTGGKWCRLLLTLKSAGANMIQYSPKYIFEEVALLVGSPYKLTLRDMQNRVVHAESGSLGPFVTWLWSRHRGTGTMRGDYSSSSYSGTVTLLEFLPGEAGQYLLSLEITDKVEAEYPGSSSTWEILEVELSAREDVIPLSKTVNYPHKRVCI